MTQATLDSNGNVNTLTPRQESSKKNLKLAKSMQDAYNQKGYIGKTIRSKLVSSVVLSGGIGVAGVAAYLMMDIPLNETLPYFSELKDNSRISILMKSLLEPLSELNKEAMVKALTGQHWPLVVAMLSNMDISALSSAGQALNNNKELVIFLYTVTKATSYTLGYINGDDGTRRANIADNSALNIYKEHLEKFDVGKAFKPGNSRVTHFKGGSSLLIQKAVNSMRTTWLGKNAWGNKRDKYSQAEVDCLQSLVFMELMKDAHPKITEVRNHRVYDNPAFDAIFKNAEKLAESLIPNMDNYTKFTKSVYRSLGGLENDIFDLDPSLGKDKNELTVISQFNDITLNALQAAYAEADQRKVIEHSVGQVGEEISDLMAQYPDGKIEDFQAEHLMGILSIASKSLMEFDKNHPSTIYAPVYEKYNKMQEKLKAAILQGQAFALRNGAHTGFVNLNKTPIIQDWCKAPSFSSSENSAAVSFLWKDIFGENSIQSPNISGIASAKLITEIRTMALHRSGGVENKAEKVALELGKRALFEHSSHSKIKRT
jgi:hypothetical protein